MLGFLRRKDREASQFADQMVARIEGGFAEQRSYATLWQRGLEHLLVGEHVRQPVEQIGAVYVAVRTIATSAASHQWGLYSGEDEVTDDESLREVLEMPNESTIGTELIERTLMSLECSGDCFWLPDDPSRSSVDGTSGVRGFRLLSGKDVEPIRAGVNAPVEGWRIHGKQVVEPEGLVHFSYPHPDDPVMGLAPLSAARQGYNIQWKSGRWQELFYEKGGVPPFWLKLPENLTLTDDERARIREQFKNSYLGLKNTGEVPVLGRGATLEALSVSQRDAEWIATQKLTTIDLLSIFGVPPAIAGYFEDANRSNAREQKEFFWLRLLPPKLQMIQAVMNRKVLPLVLGRSSGLEFRWKLREKQAEVLPEMVKDSIEAAKVLYEIGYPPSVATMAVGLTLPTETPDGMEIPGIHSPKPAAPAMPQSPAIGDDSEPEDETDDAEPRRFPSASRVMRDAMRRNFDRKQDALEREFVGAYGGFLKWLRNAALDSLSAPDRAAGDPFPSDDEIGNQAAARTEKVVEKSVQVGATELLLEIGRDPVFDALDPRVLRVIQERRVLISRASVRFAEFLREQIAAGVEAGETEEQLKRRVLDAFDGDRSNARTIARTETSSGFLEGREVAMRDAGIERHEWLTASDERVRATHADMDGEVRAVGEAFTNGLTRPHAAGGPAGEVINCRCVTVAVIDEDDDE